MIDIDQFINTLMDNGIGFFTGVPDSNLNDFCKKIATDMPPDKHIIAANEGNAIGIAAGYYLGQNSIPLVYMQNSGLGNAVNPLVSLCDINVYSVPMLLLIGWRGDPSIKDHAQHKTQGLITPTLLEDMNIPYRIVDEDNAYEAAAWAARETKRIGTPTALVVKKGVLSVKDKAAIQDTSYPLSREEAINIILDTAPTDSIFTATTGRAARELFELRNMRKEDHSHDFLNVGSMGHASSVGLGMALAQPSRLIICLDGDAATIMHMGSMAIEGTAGLNNYLHIILNNGVHESVGGQASAGWKIDLTAIADACGFSTVDYPVIDKESLIRAINESLGCGKSAFIDVKIHAGLRSDMPPLRFNHREAINSLRDELNKER